jgi:isocitrate dehydrogenase
MFEFMNRKEAAVLIENGITGAISEKKVTYDLHRQMEVATKVKTSEFATAIIDNMAQAS